MSYLCPSNLSRDDFVSRFGDIFEHSSWIAESAYDAGLGVDCDYAEGLHSVMSDIFRFSSPEARLGVLMSHPDLCGKLSESGDLSVESLKEQMSAGLDILDESSRRRFVELNTEYRSRFGFPFILAIKGLDSKYILETFERRILNSRDDEFAEACIQVEKIALLRLRDMLPSKN